jgi:hypothetical protein
MRCQIFKEEKINELEQSINIWLASNDGKIMISRILQSSYRYKTIISIWYYEAPVGKEHPLSKKFEEVEVL